VDCRPGAICLGRLVKVDAAAALDFCKSIPSQQWRDSTNTNTTAAAAIPKLVPDIFFSIYVILFRSLSAQSPCTNCSNIIAAQQYNNYHSLLWYLNPQNFVLIIPCSSTSNRWIERGTSARPEKWNSASVHFLQDLNWNLSLRDLNLQDADLNLNQKTVPIYFNLGVARVLFATSCCSCCMHGLSSIAWGSGHCPSTTSLQRLVASAIAGHEEGHWVAARNLRKDTLAAQLRREYQ